MSFKILLTRNSSPQEVFCWRGYSTDVLQIFEGVSVRGCDFNKVARRLCRDSASALVYSCGSVSYLRSIFPGEHLWRTASERRSFYIPFLIYSF